MPEKSTENLYYKNIKADLLLLPALPDVHKLASQIEFWSQGSDTAQDFLIHVLTIRALHAIASELDSIGYALRGKKRPRK